MKHHPTIVCQDHWCSGSVSGGDIDGVLFQPFKGFDRRGVARKPGCYGKRFATQDECDAWALLHGFTQIWHPRPTTFIYLRLSPRTRRHMWFLCSNKERWDFLERISTDQKWVHTVRTKECFEATRAQWERYMAGDWQVERPQRERNERGLRRVENKQRKERIMN